MQLANLPGFDQRLACKLSASACRVSRRPTTHPRVGCSCRAHTAERLAQLLSLLSKFAGTQTLLEEKIRNVTALTAKAGFSQKFSFAVGKLDNLPTARESERRDLLPPTRPALTMSLYQKWFGVFESREITLRRQADFRQALFFGCVAKVAG